MDVLDHKRRLSKNIYLHLSFSLWTGLNHLRSGVMP